MQSDLLIRQMRFEDLDDVYTLETQLFPNPWPKAFFENDLKREETIAFVVQWRSKMIGYSIAACVDAQFHITNIAVDESCQRQGIGSRLMCILEDIAAKRGCRYAFLEVRTENVAAINMYKGLGYKIERVNEHYYIDGDDAYVMGKELI